MKVVAEAMEAFLLQEANAHFETTLTVGGGGAESSRSRRTKRTHPKKLLFGQRL
jgi:hypothetical protein